MIKLVYAIARRAGMPPEAFRDHWLNVHGPKVSARAGAIGALKYVQSHLLDHPANEGLRAPRDMRPPLDGITEIWWDSLDAFNAAYATPEGAEADRVLAEDEERFIDFSRSSVFMTQEHPIFDRRAGGMAGPDPVKITYQLAARPGMSRADCHRIWRAEHAALATSVAETLGLARYVQSHTIPGIDEHPVRRGVAMAPAFDGITEVWVDRLSDIEAWGETEARLAAGAALAEDERRFVDLPRSHCFLAREHVIFDRAG